MIDLVSTAFVGIGVASLTLVYVYYLLEFRKTLNTDAERKTQVGNITVEENENLFNTTHVKITRGDGP